MSAFRPYTGKWVIKEHTLKANAGDVKDGDLAMVTDGGATVELATSSATALVGIIVGDYANSASTQTIHVQEPLSKRCQMIGPVTSGAIAVGRADSGRSCDVNDHEGVAVDTDTEHHLTIVKGTVATDDGSVIAGEGIFEIAQTLDNLNSF
ncbi:MAG: hypothetical protein GWP09_02075 [Nitrospiraceae bacterium]|nr:hypothetical protein [Nitrospiraceae bacterium]